MRLAFSIFVARNMATLLVGSLAPLAWSQQLPRACTGPGAIFEPQSGANFLAIALLRWYDANQTASFRVGMNPNGLAFDGANMWVVNYSSNNVMKLAASDGTLLGTFNVGTNPYAAAFDGANMWVVNYVSNTVTKLRASDGALLGTFNVGIAPRSVAFDGANMWVANYASNNVTKLRATDGVY